MIKSARIICRLFLVCASTCLFTCTSNGQEPRDHKSVHEIEQEVLKVEQERDRAMQEHDAKVLNEIYADKLSFINTRGQKFSKAERMAAFGGEEVKYFSYKQGDYAFHVYGSTVVMTGITSSVVQFHGRVNQTPRRFTNVYVKLDGHWRLAAHESTPIVH